METSSSPWCANKEKVAQYVRRRPETTDLYRLVQENYEILEIRWDELFAHNYGSLRDVVKKTFAEYLDCGILEKGCARAKCTNPKCSHSGLIAFSCKKRGVCPSCGAKRSVLFAEHLHENIIPAVAHRHTIFSIPKILRLYFRYNRKLCTLLFRSAWESLQEMYKEVLPSGTAAAAMVLQSSGAKINFNPHLHALVADGVFDEGGVFHELGYLNLNKATEIFSHKVMKYLAKEELLSEYVIQNILSWKHSGFSVWQGEQVMPDDESYRLFLANYIDRAPVANSKLLIDENFEKSVFYDGGEQGIEQFYPLEFLAKLSCHVPNTYESITRYYGEYSYRRRGERKRAGITLCPESAAVVCEPLADIPDKRTCNKSWASLIKRIFEIDPLVCEKCGSDMKIVAFITKESEVVKLIDHLGIPRFTPAPAMRAPPIPQELF
jgi:hypothetical protein